MKEFSRTNDCVTDIQSHSQISSRKDAAIVYGSGAIHFALFFHGARPGNRAGRTHPTIRSDISGCQNVGCALDSSAVTEPDTGLNFLTRRSYPAIAWHQQLSGPPLLARDLPVSTPRRSPDGSEESLNNPTPHKVPAAPVTKIPCRGSGSAKPRCPRLAKTQKLGGMAVCRGRLRPNDRNHLPKSPKQDQRRRW